MRRTATPMRDNSSAAVRPVGPAPTIKTGSVMTSFRLARVAGVYENLHATLEWSHELLTASERVLLHRLAVFAGVFDLDAAGAVAASPELATYEVVDVLSNLVSKSLVDRNPTGYRLLETIHAFALEKLAESGEPGSNFAPSRRISSEPFRASGIRVGSA